MSISEHLVRCRDCGGRFPCGDWIPTLCPSCETRGMVGSPIPLAGPSDPGSPDDWQSAVEEADALLESVTNRRYGLVDCDGRINAERCEDILRLGAVGGFKPSQSFLVYPCPGVIDA